MSWLHASFASLSFFLSSSPFKWTWVVHGHRQIQGQLFCFAWVRCGAGSEKPLDINVAQGSSPDQGPLHSISWSHGPQTLLLHGHRSGMAFGGSADYSHETVPHHPDTSSSTSLQRAHTICPATPHVTLLHHASPQVTPFISALTSARRFSVPPPSHFAPPFSATPLYFLAQFCVSQS